MRNSAFFGCALAAAVCAGCIDRTMQIRTDPPGAMVWVDDEPCGTTPVDVPFTAYGTRSIILQMESKQTRSETVKLHTPWYSIFPIDFAADVLCPVVIHDDKRFDFTMEPLERADTKDLEKRANEFVEHAKAILAKERTKRGLPDPSGIPVPAAEPPAVEPPPAEK